MSNLTKFNNQILEIVEFLIKNVKNNRDIKIFKEKFDTVKKYNPQIVLSMYVKYIYVKNEMGVVLRDKIIAKDEAFFLEDGLERKLLKDKNAQADLKESGANEEYILNKAMNIKRIWKEELNDKQKQVMWIYFNNLVKFCDAYIFASQQRR